MNVVRIYPFICLGYCSDTTLQFIAPDEPPQPQRNNNFDGTFAEAEELGWKFSRNERWSKNATDVAPLCPKCAKRAEEEGVL